jgi:lysine-specific demethylase 3
LDSNTRVINDNGTKIKILNQVGDSFKSLVDYEWKMREKFKNGIIWKRIINGIRELCDICKTSIFNGHLACLKCGFSLCLNCYQERLSEENSLFDLI